MKNINQIIILFFFVFLSLGFQCNEDEDEQFENIFELELPFKISPVQKEYTINDTIQISALITNRSLKDLISQNQIEIECTDIPIRFYVGVRHSSFNQLNVDNLFEIIVDTINFQDYQIENNGQYSKFQANISQDIFDDGEIAIMKIIPKRKGIYMINPENFKFIAINRDENCIETNATFDKGNMHHIFDVTDSNPELLHESPLPQNTFISGDPIPRQTAEKRIFWFKVID